MASEQITATQRAYLECFERWLRSPAGPDRDGAQMGMGALLSLMRVDAAAGIVPPKGGGGVAPIGLGGHVRWHVKRGIRQAGCRFCESS